MSNHREKGNRRNPNAVALGKLGNKAGGKARAKTLTPRERSAIARKGAVAKARAGK